MVAGKIYWNFILLDPPFRNVDVDTRVNEFPFIFNKYLFHNSLRATQGREIE